MAEKETTARILREFSQYWNTNLSSEKVDAYHARWRDLTDEALVQAAAVVADSTREFFPPPGVVKDIALDLMDDQPPVDEAWALVDRYRQPGGWRVGEKMVLPERVAEALREMGGDCGMWPEKDLAFRRKDFEQVYGRLRAREKREASLALPAGRLLDAG